MKQLDDLVARHKEITDRRRKQYISERNVFIMALLLIAIWSAVALSFGAFLDTLIHHHKHTAREK